MSFRIASKEAAKSQHKHRLGAVIVKGERILATGFNQLRPSSRLKTTTLHAEAAAILKLLKEGRLASLAGSEIYVSRFTAGGSIGLARPCSNCLDLCRSVGIRRVHYTTSLAEGTLTESID
jgi:deoxycytidylate deaminase